MHVPSLWAQKWIYYYLLSICNVPNICCLNSKYYVFSYSSVPYKVYLCSISKKSLIKHTDISVSSSIPHIPYPFPSPPLKNRTKQKKKLPPLSFNKASCRITVKLLFPRNTITKASQGKHDLKAGRTTFTGLGQTSVICKTQVQHLHAASLAI